MGSSLTVNRKGERERERETHFVPSAPADVIYGMVLHILGAEEGGPPQLILSRNIFTETPSAMLS